MTPAISRAQVAPATWTGAQVFYDVDFENQTAGKPAAVDPLGPFPRTMPGMRHFGTSMVANTSTINSGKAMRFLFDPAGSSTYSQYGYSLSFGAEPPELPDLPSYYVSFEIVFSGFQSSGVPWTFSTVQDAFSVACDTPSVVRLDFMDSGEILASGTDEPIGSFEMDRVYLIEILVHLSTNRWEIHRDGLLMHEGTFFHPYPSSIELPTSIREVRLNLNDGTTFAGSPSAEIDNIVIAAGPRPSLEDPCVVARVNAGGPAWTDPAGRFWAADHGFSTGRAASVSAPIANTVADALYRSERWDPGASPDLAYAFPVPNGDYQVRLHFAEIYSGAFATGRRVFDVFIENALALDNLDIFAEVGADTAMLRSVPATVADGQLDIRFVHGVEDPKISAIEIIRTTEGDFVPPTAPGNLQADTEAENQVFLHWEASDDDVGVSRYLVFRDGVLIGETASLHYQDTNLPSGRTYVYDVVAEDTSGNTSAPATVSARTPGTFVSYLRVNAGGGAYTDIHGNVWAADHGYNTGRTGSTTRAIGNTDHDALYQTERWDPGSAPELEYRFNLPNGDYLVELHFAEIYTGAARTGGRVFDVVIEDQITEDIDIFAGSGAFNAVVYVRMATISDGELNIKFLHGVEDPKISAIEIIRTTEGDYEPPPAPINLQADTEVENQVFLHWGYDGAGVSRFLVFRDGVLIGETTSGHYLDTNLPSGRTFVYDVVAEGPSGNTSLPATVSARTPGTFEYILRINAGGGAYTDIHGNVWAADHGYNTGRTASTTRAIGNTDHDALYQTERWDPGSAPELEYRFNLPNGDYLVELHFAEIYTGAARTGGRVFDVVIEDQVTKDIDLFAVNGAFTAVVYTRMATISDGELNIKFLHGVEDPKISAIAVLGPALGD